MSTTPPWFAAPEHEPLDSVTVIGAGLAGCHTAFEIARRGHKVVLLDSADTVAGGASGNTAGIVKPFVTRNRSEVDNYLSLIHI